MWGVWAHFKNAFRFIYDFKSMMIWSECTVSCYDRWLFNAHLQSFGLLVSYNRKKWFYNCALGWGVPFTLPLLFAFFHLLSASTLIHTCYDLSTPRPSRSTKTPFWKRLLKVTAQHVRGAVRHGTAWHGMARVNIGRRETACGRTAQRRFLPATTCSSTEFVRISNWNAALQCGNKQRLSWARRSRLFCCENMSVV